MQTLQASLKLAAICGLIVWIIVVQTPILWFTRGPKSYILTRLYHVGTCKVLGLKFNVVGAPVTNQQTLFVCNHMSYLDISVIGSVIRNASFIAKKEARAMPVYGYLSTMQQTAFISRDRKDVVHEKNTLEDMVKNGKSLILFPEGTSTDGRDILPFKSSLFGIVLQDNVKETMAVQPMTLRLIEVDGQNPDDQTTRELYVWSREMTISLTDHLWRLCKTSGATLEIQFHEPIQVADIPDRKALAKRSHEISVQHLKPLNDKPTKNLDSSSKAA